MTRSGFVAFTESALAEVVALTEAKLGTKFPPGVYLRWWPSAELIRESVCEALVSRVYESENAIRPCVDLGVVEIHEDGTPIVAAVVAGYPPQPFGRNWHGTEGPFIYIIGKELLAGHRRVQAESLGFSYLEPGAA
jgi:hypothetical protein